MDECQCLACILNRALIAWTVKHPLSTEGLIDQLGVFVLRAILRDNPDLKGRTIGMAIVEERVDGSTERLH
jgi:hypothetical protein